MLLHGHFEASECLARALEPGYQQQFGKKGLQLVRKRAQIALIGSSPRAVHSVLHISLVAREPANL